MRRRDHIAVGIRNMPQTLHTRANGLFSRRSHAREMNGNGKPEPPAAENSSPSFPKLGAIEGMRAYLALWVLVCHVLWSSGYEADALSMIPRLLAKGRYAVEVFMIISGFVIFFLLDKQRENYKQFIVRRFFRIFPAFFALFLLAIPGSLLVLWNTNHTPYLAAQHVNGLVALIQSWWANIAWHVPVHLVMLHGAVPPAVLENSSMAFLAPAWSLSTEWQFYLVAPFAFALAVSSRPLARIILCAACVSIYVAAKAATRVFPETDSQADLPSLLVFFFIGAASYFLYKRNAAKPIFDSAFPVFASIGVFIFVLSGTNRFQMVPLMLWIIFLGLILDSPGSLSSRVLSPLFTHRLPQYLGRISYSLYLCHMLVMSIIQYCMLKLAPGLPQPVHFVLLLTTTLLVSIGLSALLYRYLEAPGTEFGKRLARKLASTPQAEPLLLPTPEKPRVQPFRDPEPAPLVRTLH